MLLPVGRQTVIDRILTQLEADDRVETVYLRTNERFAADFRSHLADSEYDKPQLSVENADLSGNVHIMDGATVTDATLERSIIFPEATVRSSTLCRSIVDCHSTVEQTALADGLIGAHSQLPAGEPSR